VKRPNLYAFYGSLRRGFHNYERFRPSLVYQFSTWIKGYQLYSLGEFPFAIKTSANQDAIAVEIFEINDIAIQTEIEELEYGYGYHVEIIFIDEQPVKIYLFHDKANYPLVSGGDWSKFFRG
jgi:gamma-glutamylcyclotransferase (GGCT)/AIG2-like uncharacterized protein YtfP